MFERGLISLLSVLGVISLCYGKIDNIDKYLKTCSRSSPDANKCILEAVQTGLLKLCDGIPEINYPPNDPYHQDEIVAYYNNNQIIINMTMKDIYVYHLKKSTVKDARLRADNERFHLEIDMYTPKIFAKGKYSGSGSYNALNIEATGEFNVTLRGLTYTWKLDGEPETIDGETYMRIKSFYMSPDIKELKGVLTNENPETQSLTDLASNFANENWRPIYRELLPLARAEWNKAGTLYSNKIFLNVPYDQLFAP